MTAERGASHTPSDPRLLVEDPEELYENAPCGYLSTSPDGTIVKVNRTFLEWTGHRRDDLVGHKRLADLLTAGGRIYHETHYAPLLRMQGAVRGIALEVVCADGRRLPVLLNSTLKRDAAGAPLLVRTTVFDARDRQEYERELLRIRDRERAARERTERLQRITALLGGALAPAEIGSVIVPELAASVAPTSAVFAVLDEDEGRLQVISSSDETVDAHREWEARANEPSSATSAAVRSGEPLFREGPAAPDDRDAVPDEANGCIVLPLVVRSRPLGVLWLGFAGARTFSDADRAFMLACAAQCAQAVERSQLHERTAEAARRAAFHARASRALDEVQSFDERAQRLLDLIVDGVCDRAWIASRTEGELRAVAAAEAGAAPAEESTRLAPQSWMSADAAAAVESAVRRGEPRIIVESPPGGTGAPAPAGRVRSYAALPLRARGHVLGVLGLVRLDSGSRFRNSDLPFLSELAERAGLALENARLYEQERDVAHALQQSLLAGTHPRDPRLEVATLYRAGVETMEVGGDWYDVFATGSGRIGIVVGDVVGRGVGAASAMGQLRSAVRALAAAELGSGHVMERLDRFVEQVEAARWATVVFADVDLETGRATFASAGHPPPVVAEPGRAPRFLWDGRSAPLGTGGRRTQAAVVLPPGARLLLYTDGLVERRGVPLDHGLARLANELDRRRSTPLPDLLQQLTDVMLAGEQYRDDVCLLCAAFDGRGMGDAARLEPSTSSSATQPRATSADHASIAG